MSDECRLWMRAKLWMFASWLAFVAATMGWSRGAGDMGREAAGLVRPLSRLRSGWCGRAFRLWRHGFKLWMEWWGA